MKVSAAVTWNTTARAEWDRLTAEAGAAYQQDWAYGDALAGANPKLKLLRGRVERADGSLIAIAQIASRPFAMAANFALCTLGPVWVSEPTDDEKRAAFKALGRALPVRWPRLLVATPDEAREQAGWLKGFSRVTTGDATVLIDLTPDETALRAQLDGKWRNALVKAEKSDLKAERGGSKPAQYRWLLDAEMKQREARGYRALPAELTEAWQAAKLKSDALNKAGDKSGGIALYRAELNRQACAGMLFLVHGTRATYHVGWNDEAGRANAAHNLLLWTAMLDLKARGVATLDLGGVNTQSGAGIARFKLGVGGRVLQRAGGYV